MAAPRPPTDQESAPFLQRESERQNHDDEPSLYDKLAAFAAHPLSTASKVLLGLCLFLLLLSSIFIGLFAGAQHRLSKRPASVPEPTTITTTELATTTEVLPAPPAPTPDPRTLPCTSAKCITLAAALVSTLDTTQDPCEDFYLYTNGGWLKNHPIPSDKSGYGLFEDVAIRNTHVVKDILETPITSDLDLYDVRTLQKLQDHYHACLDEDKLNDLGVLPLLDVVRVVKQLFNGTTSIEPHLSDFAQLWDEEPTDEEDSEHEYTLPDRSSQQTIKSLEKRRQEQSEGPDLKQSLTSSLAYLHSRGIPALFQFDIEGDVGTNPNFLTLWFSQPDLGLPSKEYYEEEDITELYRGTIEKLLLHLLEAEEEELSQTERAWPPWPWPPWEPGEGDGKPENNTVKAERLSRAVLGFEKSIAAASLDLDVLQQDPLATYNPRPFSYLSAHVPEIAWEDYIATFAPRAFPPTVIVTYPEYLHQLSKILSSAEPETIEAYLISRTALTLASRLGMETEAWQISRRFIEVLSGIKKGAVGDRAEYCVRAVNDALGYASGRFFVPRAFAGDSKRQVVSLISNVIDAFKTSLPSLSWMDKNSSDAAAVKASQIKVKVGYPLTPNTESAYSIWAYYTLVPISNNTFFNNQLRATTAEQIRKWQKLGRARDPGAWEMWAQEVNAYFNPPANEIVFPAGILRDPWFEKDWPGYLKYGGAGSIISHELTHAFDSAGRKYNEAGKLEEWWTNSTSDAFDGLQQCISEQYSNYTIDDGKGHKLHLNGNLTSGENIADAGLINAFRAWKTQYNTSYELGNEYILPGLNYTQEQLFFIGFGRSWARGIRPAAAVQRVRTDPHSPSQYRVDGTLANIPEFAQAFNCPVGSKLNPPRKQQCRFWT